MKFVLIVFAVVSIGCTSLEEKQHREEVARMNEERDRLNEIEDQQRVTQVRAEQNEVFKVGVSESSFIAAFGEPNIIEESNGVKSAWYSNGGTDSFYVWFRNQKVVKLENDSGDPKSSVRVGSPEIKVTRAFGLGKLVGENVKGRAMWYSNQGEPMFVLFKGGKVIDIKADIEEQRHNEQIEVQKELANRDRAERAAVLESERQERAQRALSESLQNWSNSMKPKEKTRVNCRTFTNGSQYEVFTDCEESN